MTFKSVDSYRDFARAVRGEFRYARTPEQNEFLKMLAATSPSRSLTMRPGMSCGARSLDISGGRSSRKVLMTKCQPNSARKE